jgi:uncharacterized protein YbaR (Trm112 family)
MSYSGRHPWDADDPYPGDEAPDCDHTDYEADILSGIAMCPDCGHRWMQTAAEIERERQAQIAYDAMIEAAEREERSLIGRAKRLVYRVRQWWHRPAPPADEIPF